MIGKKIRILVVDDSSIMRKLISHMLSEEPDIEVIGAAPDPYFAREILLKEKPDLITLDLEMPKMDGISFLDKIMTHFPTRTVVISSLSQKGSELALKALEMGAIDVIAKPTIDVVENMQKIKLEILTRIKAAAKAKFVPKTPRAKTLELKSDSLLNRTTQQIIAIAASTGGTEALKEVLTQLPASIPGIVIVQHMPPMFTKTFAKSLNNLCPFDVVEAQDGDRLRPGLALLAPGNYHMVLCRSGAQYSVKLNQEPLVQGVRPAADPLFYSVSQAAGKNAIGVILTGMGKDGSQGLLAMKKNGSLNLAQDEASSVVFGMPKEAIALGAIHEVLPLHKISERIIADLSRRNKEIGVV